MTYKQIVFKLLDALESAVLGEGGDGWGALILTKPLSDDEVFEIAKEWKRIKEDSWWNISLEVDNNNRSYVLLENNQEHIVITTNLNNDDYVIRY